jgi:hypothetical protein
MLFYHNERPLIKDSLVVVRVVAAKLRAAINAAFIAGHLFSGHQNRECSGDKIELGARAQIYAFSI